MLDFDKTYWEDHWAPHTAGPAGAAGVGGQLPVNPYLLVETAHLPAGTALDAGCGTGAEALWLAEHNWQVTGADISAAALAAATDRAANRGLSGRVKWVEADLTTWEPGRCWDLVVTSYAHSQTGQLAFYQRLGSWVAPGGTLLIVGHLHNSHNSRHGDHHGSSSGHPEHATATRSGIAELFQSPDWRIDASYDTTRAVQAGGRTMPLHDVIVRAHRQQ